MVNNLSIFFIYLFLLFLSNIWNFSCWYKQLPYNKFGHIFRVTELVYTLFKKNTLITPLIVIVKKNNNNNNNNNNNINTNRWMKISSYLLYITSCIMTKHRPSNLPSISHSHWVFAGYLLGPVSIEPCRDFNTVLPPHFAVDRHTSDDSRTTAKRSTKGSRYAIVQKSIFGQVTIPSISFERVWSLLINNYLKITLRSQNRLITKRFLVIFSAVVEEVPKKFV